MSALDLQIGPYQVTERLFNFINDLSQDKQYILYKQLIKGNVVTEIFKMIIDMGEDEKIKLFERLGEIPYEDEPIRTLNLDENESFLREKTRKVCQIPVQCKVGERSFNSQIIDISTAAALIESNDRFAIGQQIVLALKLPTHPHAIELQGQIVRSGPRGIAVKFHSINRIQQDLIRLFIKNNQ